MRHRNIPWVVPAALITLLVAAGCGEESDPLGTGDDPPSTTEPTATEPSGTEQPGTEPPASESPTTGSPTTETSGTGAPATDPPVTGGGGTDGDGLTEADDGAEVTLQPGEEVPLRLSGDWSWRVLTVDGEAVELVPVDYLVDPGYTEWLVASRDNGSSEVSIAGTPACGDETVCPERTVSYRFSVEG